MNWLALLNLIAWIIGKIKDSDGDGVPDLFEKGGKNEGKE